ncbi:MAG TPA: YciI family protein [Polyangia bacterium]
MKYMLMMNGTKADMQKFGTMPPEDIHAHIAFMHRFNEELKASGELVDAQGLAGPEQAKIVRAQPGGAPAVTDGPFPEAKEFLAGYWIIETRTPERAIEIAARASAAPGRNGVALNIPIELRAIGQAPEV